ncbi:MAG: DUF5665 domain-containing protein [Pseudomonadota bacterium]
MSEDSENAKILEQLKELNAHRFVRAHDSWIGLILFNLVRGLAFGLGSVIGATVLVSIFVYFLSSIDFVPILGEYARDVIDILQEPR